MSQTRRIAVPVQQKSGWKIHWMDVTPFDGLTRYHVTTVRAGAKGYLVDLESYWGNGQCGCMFYCTTHEPVVSRWTPSQREPGNATRCRHLLAARLYLGEDLVTELLNKKRN